MRKSIFSQKNAINNHLNDVRLNINGILEFLNTIMLQFFQTIQLLAKKWTETNNLSDGQYPDNENITFKSSVLWSELCDYSGAYIVDKELTTVKGIHIDYRRTIKTCL